MLSHQVMRFWPRSQGSLGFGIYLLLLLALITTSIPGMLRPDAAPRAQAALVALAEHQPDQVIGVIVQKQSSGADVERYATQLGGAVTLDLHIINAFAAQMPAHAALALSRAQGVRWVSLDTPAIKPSATCGSCVDVARLQNAYNSAIGAEQVWNEAPKYLQGQGVGVAVVDSGMNPDNDFYTIAGQSRLVAATYFNNGYNRSVYDSYGHGQHVAGIIGGNGRRLNGKYIGVAPMVNLINVKVSDDVGGANASNVVNGLQWINDNRTRYNIKVVNISLNSSVNESYHTNPIDAAVEILWFNKITVVASAGNIGKNALFPPANDPFVITVGATDDRGTRDLTDDKLAPYSGFGTTSDGFSKPEIVAPGTNIVSMRAPGNSVLSQQHPDHNVDDFYFRMSGTSMSAPMVTGAVALLLQSEPNLTPDQVKYRLMATARPFANRQQAGAGHLNVFAAVHTATSQSANTGVPVSQLLTTGSNPINWNSVNWNSVNWNSVNWNSVNWNSVNWNSVNWNSDIW